jgi:DNA-directed RNA polymerase specialized sigma24 family protein
MGPETDNLINAEAQWKAERTKLNVPRTSLISTEKAQTYATSTDFCRVFAENMDSMHLLSLLLTADHTEAEECFVSGVEDCVKGNYVFRDWARSWAQRTIIRSAVRMLAPRRNQSTSTPVPGDPVNCRFGRTPEADAAIASILGLEDFERFVFVMSVLERYSDQDCSVLLGCSRQDVRESRMRALQYIAESVGHVDTVSNTWTGSDKVIIAPPPARSEILATPP